MQITCKNAKFIVRFKISTDNLEKITDRLLPKWYLFNKIV